MMESGATLQQPGEESGVGSSVVIISNDWNKQHIHKFSSQHVTLVTEKHLNFNNMLVTVQRHCQENPTMKNAVWLLTFSVYDLLDLFPIHTCQQLQCSDFISSLHLTEFSVRDEEMIKRTMDLATSAEKSRRDVEEYLGPGGRAVVVPLIPATAVAEVAFTNHTKLHHFVAKNDAFLSCALTYNALEKFYGCFYASWSKVFYCPRENRLFNSMTDFIKKSQYVKYITYGCSSSNVTKPWKKMMKKVIKFAMTCRQNDPPLAKTVEAQTVEQSSPSTSVHEGKESGQGLPTFKNIVVLGSNSLPFELKDTWKGNSFVQLRYEKFSFDGDGVKTIMRLQEKWPSETLWFIISEVVQLAVPRVGSKCEILHCQPPINVYHLIDSEESDEQRMKATIDSIVAEAILNVKEFVLQFPEHLGVDSAVFLAPVCPAVVTFGDRTSMTTHNKLHRLCQGNMNLHLISGALSAWQWCADQLSTKWGELITGYLEECSELATVMEIYLHASHPMLHLVNPRSENIETIIPAQSAWNQAIRSIIKYFDRSRPVATGLPSLGTTDIECADLTATQPPGASTPAGRYNLPTRSTPNVTRYPDPTVFTKTSATIPDQPATIMSTTPFIKRIKMSTDSGQIIRIQAQHEAITASIINTTTSFLQVTINPLKTPDSRSIHWWEFLHTLPMTHHQGTCFFFTLEARERAYDEGEGSKIPPKGISPTNLATSNPVAIPQEPERKPAGTKGPNSQRRMWDAPTRSKEAATPVSQRKIARLDQGTDPNTAGKQKTPKARRPKVVYSQPF